MLKKSLKRLWHHLFSSQLEARAASWPSPEKLELDKQQRESQVAKLAAKGIKR
ncbi:hypothetical protein [Dongshaea marina]|uniref:hypothetical protein n=1 Tax=Dongshaea marina TaxID=2047966 RepID=UPI00131EFE25|nr:hypothetical protein [Dongshaea marina]